MDEIGAILKEKREENGVGIEEVSVDLGVNKEIIDNIEDGNTRVFNDILELKELLFQYSKYLGVSEEDINNKFNDFLFERTSKINLDDLKSLVTQENKEKPKIYSPYTKPTKLIKERKKESFVNYRPFFITLIIALIILLVLIIRLYIIKRISSPIKELGGKYEFTEQNNY